MKQHGGPCRQAVFFFLGGGGILFVWFLVVVLIAALELFTVISVPVY